MKLIETFETTTRYEIFKSLPEDEARLFVRVTSSITNYTKPFWGIGKRNNFGGVSMIGGPILEETEIALEREYQEKIKK